MRTWAMAGKAVECKAILGRGEDFTATADEEGRLPLRLPESFSYALYGFAVAQD